jgi:hypothetical protein
VELASPDELSSEFRNLLNKVLLKLEIKGVRVAKVGETGLAHRVTSRFILEALENKEGSLRYRPHAITPAVAQIAQGSQPCVIR